MDRNDIAKLVSELLRAPEELFLENRAVDLMRRAAVALKATTNVVILPSSAEEGVPFKALAYGARFRYRPGDPVAWVKIGHDLIARWDADKVADTWVGQTVCSFSEDGDLSRAVYLIPDCSAK